MPLLRSFFVILLTSLASTAFCMKRPLDNAHSGLVSTSFMDALGQLLLQNGSQAFINKRNDEGDTPLMIAASTGTDDAVELLLAAGADINMEDQKLGARPLWLAVVEHNSPETIKALLHARPSHIDHVPTAKPNASYWNNHDPYCALSAAVLDANYPLVSLLLEHGASIDAREPYYRTPLKRAIQALDLNMVHYLLDQGKRQVEANRDIITRMILYVRAQFSSTPPLSPAASQTLTLILHKLYTV
jgi:ankyrin repeat protein